MTTTGRRTSARARTPEARLRRQAQALSGVALSTLQKIMLGEDQPAALRMTAAREVLDRALGRPKLGGAEPGSEGLTVIVKRFSEVTAQEQAEAEATEALFG
jgi:hypothetical protein